MFRIIIKKYETLCYNNVIKWNVSTYNEIKCLSLNQVKLLL